MYYGVDAHPLRLCLSRTQAGIGGPSPVPSSIAGVTYPRLLGTPTVS